MALDLTGHLEELLRDCVWLWQKDLSMHCDEAFASSSSETARSAADLAYETVFDNRRVAARLRGEAVDSAAEYPPCPEEFRTRDAMAKAMAESAEEILAALGDPEREIVLSDGSKTTAFARVQYAANHMYYHLGQLNYIQAMYGDTKIHWM